MHSFIVSGASPDKRAEFVQNKNVSQTELIHLFAEKSSITIKQIQDLSASLGISPRLPRIVWIEQADLLTIPAQNALLKMLEEPPVSTKFFLTCESPTTLLPTIRSRSKIIQLENSNFLQDPAVLTDLKRVMSLSPGDRLTSIVKRDRLESILWINQIELSLKTKLRERSLPPNSLILLTKIAKTTLAAHTALLANCSVSLVTQNFYLLLPHTRSRA